MEIVLSKERVFQLWPRFSYDQALAKAEEKKVAMVAGTFGNLFARPRPEEIALTAVQQRLEPFWHLAAHIRTVYDRQTVYNVVAGGPEVKEVSILGQRLPAAPQARSGPAVALAATEHCEEDVHLTRTFAGDGTAANDLARLVVLEKGEVADLATYQPEGVVVVGPDMSASAVVRQVMAEAVKPVKAQVIHEERLEMEAIDLYFRPVYAFEYHWAAKGKRTVIEVDGISGDVRQGGSTLTQQLKRMLNRDVLFDISADAIGTFVPGGGIVVKLTKAALDLNRK